MSAFLVLTRQYFFLFMKFKGKCQSLCSPNSTIHTQERGFKHDFQRMKKPLWMRHAPPKKFQNGLSILSRQRMLPGGPTRDRMEWLEIHSVGTHNGNILVHSWPSDVLMEHAYAHPALLCPITPLPHPCTTLFQVQKWLACACLCMLWTHAKWGCL